MAKVKNNNKLFRLSLLANLIFLPFLLLLIVYFFNPFLDYIVINKSLPRLCNYLTSTDGNSFIACNRVLKEWKGDSNLAITPSDWKLFYDSNGYFSLRIPPNWSVSFSDPIEGNLLGPAVKGKQDIMLTGKEGSVTIHWVDTYGGGCDPQNHTKIMLGNKNEDFCDTKDFPKKGMESWGSSGTVLDTTLGVVIEAIANSPSDTNRGIILTVLSTFNH